MTTPRKPEPGSRHWRLKEQTGSLYEQSGGDPAVCEFCRKKLSNNKPWRRGLDGAGAHESCIRRFT